MKYTIPCDTIRVQIDQEVCATLKVGDVLTFEDFPDVRYELGEEDPELDIDTLAERKPHEHLFLTLRRSDETYRAGVLRLPCDLPMNDHALMQKYLRGK